MTYNVWGNHYWPQRSEPLVKNLLRILPDVLVLQEVTPEILMLIDQSLMNYDRIKEKHISWSTESNIYWNTNIFSLIDHGFSSMNLDSHPNRGLFWVRLASIDNPDIAIFVSTTHLPWVGSPFELETGLNQRISTTQKICNILMDLCISNPNNSFILAGDFNEDYHPLRILQERIEFVDVYELLDMTAPITHPVRPSDPKEERLPNRTLDWITCRLRPGSRVMGAFVKASRGEFPPASDHMPVIALFEFGPNNTPLAK